MNGQMKLPSHVPLVVATRGDAVESVYYGSLAVVDAAGQLLCGVGDTEFPMFTRSTLDRKSTRLNSSHIQKSRMPSSA